MQNNLVKGINILLGALLVVLDLQLAAQEVQVDDSTVSALATGYSGIASLQDISLAVNNLALLKGLQEKQFSINSFLDSVDNNLTVKQVKDSNDDFVSLSANGYKLAFNGSEVGFYYGARITDELTFGLLYNRPYKTQTGYGKTTPFKYVGINTLLDVYRLTPGFAYQFKNNFTLGFGLDVISFAMDVRRSLQGDVKDGFVVDRAAGIKGYGFNFGVLYELENNIKFGMSYRTSVNIVGETGRRYLAAGENTVVDEVGYVKTRLPSSFAAGVSVPLGRRAQILFDYQLVNWSIFNSLELIDKGQVVYKNNLVLHDSSKLSLGLNINLHEKLSVSVGGFTVPALIDTASCSLLCNQPKQGLGFGLSYTIAKDLRLKVAYMMQWLDKIPVEDSSPLHAGVPTKAKLVGEYDSTYKYIFGIQLNYSFE